MQISVGDVIETLLAGYIAVAQMPIEASQGWVQKKKEKSKWTDDMNKLISYNRNGVIHKSCL